MVGEAAAKPEPVGQVALEVMAGAAGEGVVAKWVVPLVACSIPANTWASQGQFRSVRVVEEEDPMIRDLLLVDKEGALHSEKQMENFPDMVTEALHPEVLVVVGHMLGLLEPAVNIVTEVR